MMSFLTVMFSLDILTKREAKQQKPFYRTI